MEGLSESITVSVFLANNFHYLLLGILILNLLQRRHQKYSQAKRMATLYLAILALILMAFSILMVHFKLSDLLLIPVILGMGAMIYPNRNKIFPFRLTCQKCGRKLSFKRIIFFDSNRCDHCDPIS